MRTMLRALSLPLLLLAMLSSPISQAADLNPPQLEIRTNHGNIIIELYPDKAPKTVANFIQYVTSDYYTGTTFHRTVDRFMVQGGGLTADMREKSTFSPIENESNNGLKNEYGSIAMHALLPPTRPLHSSLSIWPITNSSTSTSLRLPILATVYSAR
nr:peptidylprolyl isomerase [Methylobacillus glycogenes]